MALFNVPFKREILDVYQVQARSRTEATMLAERARLAGEKPTFTHETKFQLGKVETALADSGTPGEPVV